VADFVREFETLYQSITDLGVTDVALISFPTFFEAEKRTFE
jgi:hypothetical protein